VRIEDLDRPREVPGASERILRTLAAFGFQWPQPVLYQSSRSDSYAQARDTLTERGLTYRCRCSRRELADATRYPGTCRERNWPADAPAALRLAVPPGAVAFNDRIRGDCCQDVAATSGDFILQRRDQLFAYALAVVVDDAHQGITHVVRGADLLDHTPCQIQLQRLLGLPTPSYAHVPVLMEADGSKLAKSRRSVAVAPTGPARQLCTVFALLGLDPPVRLRTDALPDVWQWAVARWRERLQKRPFPLVLNVC
jgi:glutamyl-Q tRNA(Asp) synthetase